MGSSAWDERLRRAAIGFGGGITTTYWYAPLAFRLVELLTTKGDGTSLQDLTWTHDAAGDIVDDLTARHPFSAKEAAVGLNDELVSLRVVTPAATSDRRPNEPAPS